MNIESNPTTSESEWPRWPKREVLERNPLDGYTKSRTLKPGDTKEVTETFQSEGNTHDIRISDTLTLSDLRATHLKKVYGNIGVQMYEYRLYRDNVIEVGFYLYNPNQNNPNRKRVITEADPDDPTGEKRLVIDVLGGESIVLPYYNRVGNLLYLELHSLPLDPDSSPLKQSEEEEEINRAFMIDFKKNKFLYGLSIGRDFNNKIQKEGQWQNTNYNEPLELMKRNFRVTRSLDSLTVHQELLTPLSVPDLVSSYSAKFPLTINKRLFSRMREEGKAWRSFINEMGLKAQAS